MPEGRIVKALSGYYYVKADGRLWQCRARGLFKKKKFSPLVGDWVRFDQTEHGEGYIQDVEPRLTELVRPPVANADQAVIVNSVREPDFQPLLVDKILVHAERAGMKPLIVLTKIDLSPFPSNVKDMVDVYKAVGYTVVMTSVVQMVGIQQLREALADYISVLAGQSGAGKTSLLNALFPGVQLQTGEISHKLGRGRHTTRHVEMIELPSGGWVVDTPGFSQLSFKDWEAEELSPYFPEMFRLADGCKFRGCLHDREPQCAVKKAVDDRTIHSQRYQHYLQFLGEIQEQRRY